MPRMDRKEILLPQATSGTGRERLCVGSDTLGKEGGSDRARQSTRQLVRGDRFGDTFAKYAAWGTDSTRGHELAE
jgi:hypothetical protein